MCSDAEQLRLAELECDLMRQRLHPNIVALLDTQVQRVNSPHQRHVLYMLMPLYNEGSLWDAMQRRGSHFSNAEILAVVTQVPSCSPVLSHMTTCTQFPKPCPCIMR